MIDDAARAAYEEDCRRMPRYLDGGKRPTWDALPEHVRHTWRLNPTPRDWPTKVA